MPASSLPPIEDLVPHRDAMRLIDAVESVDVAEGTLTAVTTIRPAWCENWVTIELMAQAAAALAGAADRAEGWQGPPRPGFLLGTRRLTLGTDRLVAGARYRVTARIAFRDTEAASFECAVFDASGARVASATLNAYRPPTI